MNKENNCVTADEFARKAIVNEDSSVTFDDVVIPSQPARRMAYKARYDDFYEDDDAKLEILHSNKVRLTFTDPQLPSIEGNRYTIAGALDWKIEKRHTVVSPDGTTTILVNQFADEVEPKVVVPTRDFIEVLEEVDRTGQPRLMTNLIYDESPRLKKNGIKELVVMEDYLVCVNDTNNGALYPSAVERKKIHIGYLQKMADVFASKEK